jgi:hypothetical protein
MQTGPPGISLKSAAGSCARKRSCFRGAVVSLVVPVHAIVRVLLGLVGRVGRRGDELLADVGIVVQLGILARPGIPSKMAVSGDLAVIYLVGGVICAYPLSRGLQP